MADLDRAAEEVTERVGEARGTLRVAAPMTFATMHLGRLPVPFLERHPKLKVVLDLNDRHIDVARGGYDLAIRVGRMEDSALISRRLATSRRVVCCSAAYARAHGLPRGLDDLRGHACVAYANVNTIRHWQFEPGEGETEPTSVPMRSRFLVNNGDLMREAASAGMGLVLLPTFIAAPALQSGELIAVPLDRQPLSNVLCAVYPGTRHLPRGVRVLIDHLAAEIGDPPFWDLAIENAPAPVGAASD